MVVVATVVAAAAATAVMTPIATVDTIAITNDATMTAEVTNVATVRSDATKTGVTVVIMSVATNAANATRVMAVIVMQAARTGSVMVPGVPLPARVVMTVTVMIARPSVMPLALGTPRLQPVAPPAMANPLLDLRIGIPMEVRLFRSDAYTCTR